MPRRNNDAVIGLTIILIILTLVMITLMVLIPMGILDKANISSTGSLIGSNLITKSQPEFGLQFRNDGKKAGTVTIKVSSNDKNISFIQDEITRIVPPTKTNYDYTNVEFALNKSIFDKQLKNFTIFLDVSHGKSNYIAKWEYIEKCYPGQRSDCMYGWVK
ncbi:hypothetical protein KAJ87_01635 [Candidatus Pacearchaeota archaeon]|nr:hypothetical protein [Candidatus Pacearchaeota archaeon]